MSVQDHKRDAPASVRCFVLTVSDTRSLENDASGRTIAERLREAGHQVVARQLVPDEPLEIAEAVRAHLGKKDCEVIITTGGTGIARRDSTVEAVVPLFDRRLDGFGELFRMLSFQEVGPAAMLSRACAGIAGRSLIFVLPGSEPAVRLAMDKLVVPELPHLVRELCK